MKLYSLLDKKGCMPAVSFSTFRIEALIRTSNQANLVTVINFHQKFLQNNL